MKECKLDPQPVSEFDRREFFECTTHHYVCSRRKGATTLPLCWRGEHDRKQAAKQAPPAPTGLWARVRAAL